jgi:hypothetical protein
MTETLIVEADEAPQRLASLGLAEAPLRETAMQAYLALSKLTPHHPRIARGLAPWMEAIAALRDHLCHLGWSKSDFDNHELIVDPEGQTAIAVMTGDEGTGRADANPSNRCPKGAKTIEAIYSNNQIDLFPELLPPSRRSSCATWILLYRIGQDELRCELSLPSEIGGDGKIKRWKERILLTPIPLDAASAQTSPIQPSLFDDIELKRRA